VPALGRSRPATIVSAVDLPQPLGPTTAQNFPAPMVILTSRTAVNSDPEGVTNRFATLLNSICAAGAAPFRSRVPRAARERLAKVLATVIISLADGTFPSCEFVKEPLT
jgi:hypothetical protein